jgi:NAD(P)-dependent dehydrogenase (short-subunit alcohol dehydrogenase family)
MSFDLQLKGLRAVVTGGTMGLGAAVVHNLVEAGARVATSARNVPAQPVDGVTYIRADLTTPDGVAHLAQSLLKDWGGVDIVINVLGGVEYAWRWLRCHH